MKKQIKALIYGLVAYFALYLIKYGFEHTFVTTEVVGSQNRTLFFIASLLALLLLVIPSYVTGWADAYQGTLIGAIVAVIGFSSSFFITSIKWGTISFDFYAITIWFEQMLMPITVGALSGAAGQLHRMNYRMR